MTNFNNLSSHFSQFHSADLAQHHTQRLEQIWDLPSTKRTNEYPSASQSGPDFLKRLGQQLLAFLTGAQSIRIWTSYSEAGVVWHVHDPISDRTSSHASETDLRIWLEKRHLS